MSAHRVRPALATAAAAAAVLIAATSCSGDPKPSPVSPDPSAANAGTPRVSVHECQEIPSDGRIYRSGSKLSFGSGSMLVAIPKNRKAPAPTTSVTPTPAPGAPAPPAPGAPVPAPPTNVLPPNPAPAPNPAPQYPPAQRGGNDRFIPVTGAPEPEVDECVSFRKWGNHSPEVPPDALLFTFRGTGTDGGQISFSAVALTGGVLPPLGPTPHPKVGPLVESIPADIGVSLGGKYYLAAGCPLKIVAMSSRRAAGHFACPTAIPMRENPLAPNDAQRDPDDDAESDPTPGRPAPAPGQPRPAPNPDATRISGWFEVKP